MRGGLRFVDELVARVRRAGEVLIRADSGFWNKKITVRLKAKGCLYTIGVRLTKPVAAAIEAIPEQAWRRLADYPETGEAEIAETTINDPGATRPPDLVQRDLTASRPNELWVSDFTYLRCWSQTLDDHGVLASIDTVGDAYDDALAESFVDSFKTELIRDRLWRSRSQLELAIVEYVAWFNDGAERRRFAGAAASRCEEA